MMEQRLFGGQKQSTSWNSMSSMTVNGGRRLFEGNSVVGTAGPRRVLQQDGNSGAPQNSPGNSDSSSHIGPLDPNVVIIMVVLLFALICAALLNSIVRCVMRRRMHARNARAMFLAPGSMDQDSEQGLDAKTLASLPVLTFKAAENSTTGAASTALDCTICLNEFTEEERLRLLPKCSHVFHLDCIDMWLLSHVSCPVCRAAIEDEDVPATNGEESPDAGGMMLLVRDSAGNASVRRSTGGRILEPGGAGAGGLGGAETLDVRAELTRDKSWNSLSDAARLSSSRRLVMGSRENSMSRRSFRATITSIMTSSDNHTFPSARLSSSSVPAAAGGGPAPPSPPLAGSTSSPNELSSLAANDQLRDRSSSPPPIR